MTQSPTPVIPLGLDQYPRIDQWLDFSAPGRVRIFSGKVELGQGINTAMSQIAAEALELPVALIDIVSGDTALTPNEGFTAGSFSIEMGGLAMHSAGTEAKRALLEAATIKLNCDIGRLSISEGAILRDGAATGLDYWKLAPELDMSRAIPRASSWYRPGSTKTIGHSVQRLDLPSAVFGAAFIQDIELPGMVHGRVLRPLSVGTHLLSLDESAAKKIPGVVKIVRSGDFVAVCCEREYQAIKAQEALRAGARWSDGNRLPDVRNWREFLMAQPTLDSETESGQRKPETAGQKRVSATYSKPMIAHASMGPSCALARFENGHLTVWTHSQGVFPLRKALSMALGLDENAITVTHSQGAGCYGHNGADDVAMDAALLARELSPRPVRVQWMREDELGWAPFGSPMVVKLDGAIDAGGMIADWQLEIWSGPHGGRPTQGNKPNLLAAAHMDPPQPLANSEEIPALFFGGDRNATALYDLPRQRIVHHKVHLPFRLSSLRTLGAYGNVMAIESFMDEMAEAAGADPVAFRLKHLSDPRARGVIEAAARIAGWKPGAARGQGKGRGIAFSRYKNVASFVAVIVEVEVDDTVRVPRAWCAVDAGLVINPDGLRNQIEGGLIQAVSWTLKEQVGFDATGITSRSWEQYPILGFAEAPRVQIEIVENPDCPPLGAGEAAHGPTAAAILNAVACALDFRIRDLPLTRDRILAAMG